MSICPKNKSSKSRRDKRRANWLLWLIEYVRLVVLTTRRKL